MFEIGGDIRFELGYAPRAEGMGDCFPFSSMFFAISSVEEATVDGDESVIVLAIYDGKASEMIQRWRI